MPISFRQSVQARGRIFYRTFASVVFVFLLWNCAAAAASPETIQLKANWTLASAKQAGDTGATISQPSYATKGWYPVRQVPATVLEILQEDGIYPNLYYGKNLLTAVPQDLYKQDWWYRTSFQAPAQGKTYWLEFPGINYRAEIWLNGKRIADSRQVVGMYVATQLNVTDAIAPGQRNTLAVKVTPERAIQDVNGVEMGDSWFDWLNGKYLGSRLPPSQNGIPTSFVSDRNAGIWKPVTLRVTGSVQISHPAVTTALPLPKTDSARLTVFGVLQNGSSRAVQGRLLGRISRPGKPVVAFEQPVSLAARESREVSFTPERFQQLVIGNPDLWWPYTMGQPNLYNLELTFQEDAQKANGLEVSDRQSTRFGIRVVTQHRDQDAQFPEVGKGGNFYLQVNGKDFLVRGAVYTPDLLYRDDPAREEAILGYVKDMGLNMLRWESKISSEHIVELADQAGIPLMFGWMCCNQWEKWDQWDAEDKTVARSSLRSQISMLRSHPAVFIWANGSDGLPPAPVLQDYHRILTDLHWQNAIVDTVSSFAKDKAGNKLWSGIIMEGPYSWRPPSYWNSGLYPPTRGSSAEQGDNEIIPPYESLKKFIPPDKLWPINDTWFFHAGSSDGNNSLRTIQRVVEQRYGAAHNAEEFAAKAQLAHYENARAQFEDFAANGWANHKMTIYWMLNNHWPSFFGHLFDYYLKPAGAYFGAKKGLRPLSVVFDNYAKDKSQGIVRVVNQSLQARSGLRVRVRVYNLEGKSVFDQRGKVDVKAQDVAQAMTLPALKNVTSVYFVRCELFDGARIVDNVYWQSTTPDRVGPRANDKALNLTQEQWADFTPLQAMAKVHLDVKGTLRKSAANSEAVVSLHNPSNHLAFFVRVEITGGKDGNEILPVTYDDNYVTVFPGETVSVHGKFNNSDSAGKPSWIRVEGTNAPKQLASIP
jgi:exo-1,4-beta-D-glucosaminidase